MAYFHVVNGRIENEQVYKEQFVLIHGDWNDFWKYETQYYLIYFTKDNKKIEFGEVKIGSIDESRTPDLPKDFDSLNSDFFSLGQSQEYYALINKHLDDISLNPLDSLNDIAKNLQIFEENRSKDIMKTSLLRGVSTSTVTRQFHRIATGGTKLTPYNFSYVFNKDSLDDSSEKNKLEFKVKVGSLPPTNIHVLIGRNSVGKTRVLNNIIEEFLNKDNKFGYFEVDGERVDDPYQIFPNLIYMSYSAFDDTIYVDDQIDEILDNKYVYIGLRKKQKDQMNSKENIYLTKNLNDLILEFYNSIEQCRVSTMKRERLVNSLRILESDPIFKMADITSLLTEKKGKKEIEYLFKKLSTGHRVILITITKLVETVEEKSLILLDEPETHLHPPLLSSFIRCLSELVVNRNAVAIIATHSPVILQEVPKSCVWVLKRNDSICKISRPRMETFGENYTNLVEDVFGLEIENSGFHKLLKDQVNKLESFDELKEKFNLQLGQDADIIARTMFLNKKNKEEKHHESE